MKRTFRAWPRHPVTGRQVQISAHSARELEAYLHRFDAMRTELRAGMASTEDVNRALRRLRFGPVTLAKAALSYARRGDLAANTRKRVAYVVAGPLVRLAPLELEAIDAERLAREFEAIARSLTRASVAQVWRTLGAIARHASELGYIGRAPWHPWRPRPRLGLEDHEQRDCARTPAELEALIRAARELDELGPYRALGPKVATGGSLGLRQGELAGLRWYDVYPDRATIGVRRQWDGRPLKAGEVAELHAPAIVFDLLEAHRARFDPRPTHGDPVFPKPGGGHYAQGACLSIRDLRAVVARAGFDPARWTVHSLRDSFVTIEAGRSGGDLRRVQERSRHRSLSSLFRYLHALERGAAPPALPPPGVDVT